jgi:predicted GNAT family N-acyltransferase
MPADRHAPHRPYALRLTQWQADEPSLRAVRHAVFVVEQRIPAALEWDEADRVSLHALAEDGQGTPIGCGRLLIDGYIGRMAVLAAWRGRGVGGALLETLVEAAQARGHRRVVLRAQTHALPFYARHGFRPFGDEFLEADIPHQAMERLLPQS